MSLHAHITRVFRRFRNLALVRWVYEHQELFILQLNRDHFTGSVNTDDVQLNHRDALKHFVETESWHNSHELLEEFSARIDRGEVVGTIVSDKVLAAYLWLNPGQSSAHLTLVRQDYVFPTGSSTLYNGYTHPAFRGVGHFQQIISRLVEWCFEKNPQGTIHVAVEPGNAASLYALQKVGFRRVAKLGFTCFLGRIKTDREVI